MSKSYFSTSYETPNVQVLERFHYRCEFYNYEQSQDEFIHNLTINDIPVCVILLDDGMFIEVDGEVDVEWVKQVHPIISNLLVD